MMTISKQQYDEITDALVDFVKRVAKESRTATPAEVEALPKVAAVLFDSTKLYRKC